MATVEIHGHKVKYIGDYGSSPLYSTDDPELFYALYTDKGWVKVAKSDSVEGLRKELDRLKGIICPN